MVKRIAAKGDILISSLATGETSIAVSHGKGTMGALLSRKQVAELIIALRDSIFPE